MIALIYVEENNPISLVVTVLFKIINENITKICVKIQRLLTKKQM